MEDVRAVAFVKGPEFETMASLTIPRAERVLGCPVERIQLSDGACVSSERLQFMDSVKNDQHILLIDVDMVFCSWDWRPFQLGVFNGVRDYPLESWAGGNLKQSLGLDASKAINGGMWLAARKHAEVFNRAEEERKKLVEQDYFLRMGDQIALNMALQQLQVPINYIPDEYNFQVSPANNLREVPSGTKVIHLVGNSVGPGETPNPKKKLERVREAIDAFPLD